MTDFRPLDAFRSPRFAPRDTRQHSSLIRLYHPVLKVSPFEVLRIADLGDVDVNPMNIEDTFARVEQAVNGILDAGAVPVCVGGDHSLSLAILRAVARRHGPVGMVHVDSHQDIDGVDPAFAPGTGTPEVGGLTSREALELVRALVGSLW
ncbi:MAG: arginase family protein [Armatimonadota bacterium]